MAHKLQDKSRRDINLNNKSVQEVLPEWFVSDNIKIIKFLKNYYEFLDSDGVFHEDSIVIIHRDCYHDYMYSPFEDIERRMKEGI